MSLRMEFKAGSPHRTTQSEYSRYQTKLSGSCVASQPASRIFEAAAASLNSGNLLQKREFGLVLGASESLDLAQPKMNEKELLHGLNDRFAGFIEKVRQLEHQNQLLEREIEDIRQKAQSPSSLAQRYEPELRDLRKLVNDITLQKRQIELEHQDLEEDVLTLREKYNQEAHNRSDVENNIMVLKKDINDAYLAKLQLDKKAQSMVDEIHFLKKNHKVEVSGMLAQMQDTRVKVEAHDFGITAALRDIRAQLEGHAVSDIQQAEECFRVQFAKLTKAAETNREALNATKQEIQEHRRRLQGKNIELDCAKGTREALTKQLNELEDRHNAEMVHYQDTIRQLENELTNTKFDMSGHLREFQDLLNVKMALDVEIISYRQLLEGEENRLTISDTHISMPYIYRQSPVYTLPCLARQGGPTRRAEPQYKFVEEIITETTREVEMSEFEETGSEETVGGEGEDQRKREEHAKAERGSSEEVDEEEDKEEDKAAFCEEAPEKEDEQVETLEEATEHGDGVSPVEAEEGDEGKEETGDEPDAGDRKEDTVNPIQSEVNSVEATSDEEKYKLGTAENIDNDKKNAGEKLQKDDPSKREDSQTPIEDTISKVPIRSEPEDSQKQSPLKESKEVDVKEAITPLMEQKPEMDTTDMKEFKDSDQPTEPGTVQEEALPVPSEETSTDKTSTEVTAEMKGTLTKEIGGAVKSSEDTKAPEVPGTTPEREMSPEEPNVSSKDESVKTTEEETKDDSKDEKCFKESETPPTPDLMAIPKEEEIKENSSGDKAKTGAEESIVPEQQVTAVAESKESHSVAPESIKTQVKSEEIAQEPEKVQVPIDLPNKTESAKTKESEVVTKSQKEATPEQVEISIAKTSAVKEDVSAMGLKEKAVDEKKTEKKESKIENGFSEDRVNKDDKTEYKTKEQADPIKEKNAEPKTSV